MFDTVQTMPHSEFKNNTRHTITVQHTTESSAMTRLALSPLPSHQGLAKLAMMMLRVHPAPPLLNQLHEMNALSQIDIEDWDKLFHAVESRLCASVAAADLTDDKTRVTILECVEALDQLHSALTRERQQRRLP
jgi:hypothetical protein